MFLLWFISDNFWFKEESKKNLKRSILVAIKRIGEFDPI